MCIHQDIIMQKLFRASHISQYAAHLGCGMDHIIWPKITEEIFYLRRTAEIAILTGYEIEIMA
jgi:hypothetical protein